MAQSKVRIFLWCTSSSSHKLFCQVLVIPFSHNVWYTSTHIWLSNVSAYLKSQRFKYTSWITFHFPFHFTSIYYISNNWFHLWGDFFYLFSFDIYFYLCWNVTSLNIDPQDLCWCGIHECQRGRHWEDRSQWHNTSCAYTCIDMHLCLKHNTSRITVKLFFT